MHPCAHCLLGFETLEIIEFRNREGVDYGLGRPQYVGSSAIVYAGHEVVFLQSDQADRAIGAWIDIPLHLKPLMRASEGYGGVTAREALGIANGAGHRPAPALASGPRTGRYPGDGSKDLPSIDNARLYPHSVSLLLRYSASLSFNSRVSRLSLALKARVRTARMAR